ncbi:MAG: Modulator of FtsH protease HflK [Firmicutes bacterium]|nr:Modulator of FtsH protease HflK [Bacillota bacterium]MBT9157398.1 Modulator of FtsH protease HflK [Bacillota bacterium]
MDFEVLFFLVLLLFVFFVATRTFRVIRQSTIGVVERLGSYHRLLPNGLHFVVPFIDRVLPLTDLREHVLDYPPQPVITKDNVTMQVDTVIYYQITDPVKATYELSNLRGAIEKLTQTTIRNVIGELSLDETLTSRERVNAQLRIILDEATDKWGVKVNRIELKSIEPPQDIKEAMEKQMRAERNKRAQILTAEGERQSNILISEGRKQATILEAEGARTQVILAAEAEAEAIIKINEARARGLSMLKGVNPDQALLTIQGFDALREVAKGQATKIIIPSDLAGLAGTLKALAEIVKD